MRRHWTAFRNAAREASINDKPLIDQHRFHFVAKFVGRKRLFGGTRPAWSWKIARQFH
jgi:hypothetical protein